MRPEVSEAMAPFASVIYGNSSGVHDTSRQAKNALEAAREQLASLLGASPRELVFTSGGTESDNLALKGVALNKSSRSGVVTAATEHDAVLETVDFLSRTGHGTNVLPVDESGLVEGAHVVGAINDVTAVVSLMLVNNETGAIHDIRSMGAAIKATDPEVAVHCDAVQGASSFDLDVDDLGVDLMSLSGHKIGGPKGVGVLYVREGVALEPVLHGGGQELGRRSGTHNVAGVVGLATAFSLAVSERERFVAQVGALRDDLEKRLQAGIEGLEVNTPLEASGPHILNVRIPAVRNETLLLRLDQAGVAASAGSACQSGAATISHVLEAMGRTAVEARESIRLSLGHTSTHDEVVDAAAIVVSLAGELR
jgi:cysteine desulfurase